MSTPRDLDASGPVVVSVDVGTTNIKVVAYALDGVEEPVVHRSPVPVDAHGVRHEIDPGALLQAVGSALTACLAALGSTPVAAIGVATAMHALCALDDDDRALTPIITWADGRAEDRARSLRRGDWHERTGVPVHPMAPMAKLAWFAEHEPERFERVRRWVDLKALVLHALTGTWVTDVSSASGWGLIELGDDVWSPELLGALGVDPAQLPEVVAVTAVAPCIPDALGLTPAASGVPVVAGAGDGPAANLGAGATGAGVAALSMGTSAAVRVASAEPCLPGPSRFTYRLDATRWVTGGAISNAGSVVDWVRELVDPGAAAPAIMARAAAAPPGADGLTMVPWLLPERAPRWDPSLTASLVGLRSHHGPSHVARAAFEGVAHQIAQVADTLAEVGPVTRVRASGGAFVAPLWSSLVAAALARPIEVLEGVEASARGVAALALVGVGAASSADEAVRRLGSGSARERTVEPDAELVRAATDLSERMAAR